MRADLFAEFVRFGYRFDFTGPQIVQNDDKFIATEAGNRIAFAHRGDQSRRNFDEDLISSLMPQRIVDGFEIVHVDEQQCAEMASAFAGGKLVIEAVQQQATVRKIGQRVDESS